jgi:hypothetical protein
MLNFLNKPYPFNDDLRHNAKIIFFISIGVLIFLLLFQPIEISSFSRLEIFYLAMGLGASTFLTLSVNLLILPSLFPNLFHLKKWNIKKEILWNIWILFAISASHFLFYTKLFGLIDLNLSIILKLLMISILPVVVLITINQDRLLKLHLKSAIQLNKKLNENRYIQDKLILFESDYKKDNLSIKANSFICLRSANNYIEIFYLDEEKVVSQMVRCTLIKSIELLTPYEFIFRCHRTFVINTNYIHKIEGNSQGYKLTFKNIDFQIPVSQKYLKDFKKLI